MGKLADKWTGRQAEKRTILAPWAALQLARRAARIRKSSKKMLFTIIIRNQT